MRTAPRSTTSRNSLGATRRPAAAVIGAVLTAVLTGTLLLAIGPPATAAPAPGPTPPVTATTVPEPPSPYQGQVSCDPVDKRGTVALRDLLARTYGANSGGISRTCDNGGRSEHKEGRAYDWSLDAFDPVDKAIADEFLAWLTGPDAQGVPAGNAHRLGIQYVIWNKQTWQSWTGAWKPYTGYSPHTDHIHFSLSWDGAMRRTSWWTGSAVQSRDYGPCQVYTGEFVSKWSAANYTPCPRTVPRVDGIVTADFDGDGRTEMGTYDNGTFSLQVGDKTVRFTYGQPGDVPVAGDWDGDGKAGIGVYRNGVWYLRNSLSSGRHTISFKWGGPGYHSVVGDWDGDGADSVGVFRSGTWILRSDTSANPGRRTFRWAGSNDRPVAGDWNGDGIDTVGVYRSGNWRLGSGSSKYPTQEVSFGHTAGLPAVGDFDRDGRTTLGTVGLGEFAWTDDPMGGNRQVSRVQF